MRNEGGGFAASIYGAMPESRIQVTSHKSLVTPNPSSLLSNSHSYKQKRRFAQARRRFVMVFMIRYHEIGRMILWPVTSHWSLVPGS